MQRGSPTPHPGSNGRVDGSVRRFTRRQVGINLSCPHGNRAPSIRTTCFRQNRVRVVIRLLGHQCQLEDQQRLLAVDPTVGLRGAIDRSSDAFGSWSRSYIREVHQSQRYYNKNDVCYANKLGQPAKPVRQDSLRELCSLLVDPKKYCLQVHISIYKQVVGASLPRTLPGMPYGAHSFLVFTFLCDDDDDGAAQPNYDCGT